MLDHENYIAAYHVKDPEDLTWNIEEDHLSQLSISSLNMLDQEKYVSAGSSY